MIWSPAVAILASYFTAAERGKAIGINTGAVYCGLSVGPFWGGLLTELLGWRSIFYITAVLVAVAAVLAFWKLKGERAESRGEKLDISGSTALIISLILILYGFSVIPGFISIPFIFLGFLGILVFYRIEIKTANPVLNVSLFRNNRVFVLSLLGILLTYCATFAPTFLLSLYLQYNKGFSPATAGAILVIQPAVMAVLAPVSGRVSDKVEPLKVSLFGMGMVCIALVLFAFLSEGSAIWFIFIGLTVLGTGFGFFASPVTNAVMSSVDSKFFGVASGAVAALRHSGQVFSMGIVMILLTIYIGNVQITPPYYTAFLHSFKAAFIIFAGLCCGSILALLAASKAKKSR
jgi:MFS family permease